MATLTPLRVRYASPGVGQDLIEMTTAEMRTALGYTLARDYAGALTGGSTAGERADLGVTTAALGVDQSGLGIYVDTYYTEEVDTIEPVGTEVGVDYQLVSFMTPGLASPVRPVARNVDVVIELTDSEINSIVLDPIIADIVAGNLVGDYTLGITASGAPAGGTWASVATMSQTTHLGLINQTYTLWRRTAMTSPPSVTGNLPVKIDGVTLKEMIEPEMRTMTMMLANRIINNNIGQWRFSASTPTPGTWVQRGVTMEADKKYTIVFYPIPDPGFNKMDAVEQFTGNSAMSLWVRTA